MKVVEIRCQRCSAVVFNLTKITIFVGEKFRIRNSCEIRKLSIAYEERLGNVSVIRVTNAKRMFEVKFLI